MTIVTFTGLEKNEEKSTGIIKDFGFDLKTLMKTLSEIEFKIFETLLNSDYALNRREIQLKIKEKSWHKVDRALTRLAEQKLIFSRTSDEKQKMVWFVNPIIYKLWKDKKI